MDNNNCIVRFDDGQESSSEESRPIFSIPNLFALIFAFLNMMLNFLVIAIIHERVPRFYNNSGLQEPLPPLPDITAEILPEWPWGLDVAEYIISVQAFTVFILLFLHKSRVTIFRRVCILMGLLYFYRAICMLSTQVPLINSDYCAKPMTDAQKNDWGTYLTIIFQRMFHMMFGFGLSINGKHIYCGDYIYSGHTITLTFFYLTLKEYLVPKNSKSILWIFFDAITFLSSILGVIFILIARGHYTLDIILAYYVTTRTFYIYHTLIYDRNLRYKSRKNFLSRFWWWYLMKYFEYDHVKCSTRVCPRCDAANTEVIRQFAWPISWPRSGKRSTSLQRLLSQAT